MSPDTSAIHENVLHGRLPVLDKEEVGMSSQRYYKVHLKLLQAIQQKVRL